MEEFVDSAIKAGLKEVCFLDHFTKRNVRTRNSMTQEEIPQYCHEVQELQKRYADQIRIKVGLEVDFNPKYISLFEDIVGRYQFDCIGSSVHFINDINIVSRHVVREYSQLDTVRLFYSYIEEMFKMINYNYFDIVCHLDVIKKFGLKADLSLMGGYNTLLAEIKKKGLVVELNTSGYAHPVGEPYPSLDILTLCHKADIEVTLGSDAHSPEEVARFFDKGISTLLDVGYRSLTVFDLRRKGTVPILWNKGSAVDNPS